MLNIAERRAITGKASADGAFLELLKHEPATAVRQATGRALPAEATIDVREEGEIWELVLIAPEAIEADLPAPQDWREVWENVAYTQLRDDPALYDSAERDPRGFLADRLEFDMSSNEEMVVHTESATKLVLVVANPALRDELSESMLDLVTGGGSPACNPPVGMDQEQAVRAK